MTEYARSTELTAARVRHLAHRGQLPETARMLAEEAARDYVTAQMLGDMCMAKAKAKQHEYWMRRTACSTYRGEAMVPHGDSWLFPWRRTA